MQERSEPRERLRRWVEELGSKKAAAAKLGCHPSYLVHLLNPERHPDRRPGLDVATAIERATRDWPGGQILAVEWAAPPNARTGTEGAA